MSRNHTRRARLAIVVLAAGYSSRLGRSKPLVRILGRSQLDRLLDLLHGLDAGECRVVIPPRARRLEQQIRARGAIALRNPARHQGMSSSIQRGLRSSRPAAAVLFLPVDLVDLDLRELSRLVRRWQGAPRRVIARRLEDGRGGTPLILPRWLWSRAVALQGERGLKTLIPTLPAEQRILVNLPSAATDIDTPAELARARRRAWRSAQGRTERTKR